MTYKRLPQRGEPLFSTFREERKHDQSRTPPVADLMRQIGRAEDNIDAVEDAFAAGKFSPEAAQYTSRWLRRLAKTAIVVANKMHDAERE